MKEESKQKLEELKQILKEREATEKALKEANKALDNTLEKLNKQEIGMAEYFMEKLEEKIND